jgi:hypothetical protein
MAFAAIPVLTILLSSTPARAQTGAASYTFLIGSGFHCDAGDSGACPAVVKSEGGDTFEFSGAGIFDPRQKPVMATGTTFSDIRPMPKGSAADEAKRRLRLRYPLGLH